MAFQKKTTAIEMPAFCKSNISVKPIIFEIILCIKKNVYFCAVKNK